MTHWPPVIFFGVSLTLSGAICDVAFADELSTQADLSASFTYDDNPRLSLADADELSRARLRPSITTTLEGERHKVTANGAASFAKSFDHTVEDDRIDYDIGLGSEYYFESSEIGADLSYAKQSIRDTEIDDTGRFGRDATRSRRRAQADWQQELSDLWSLNLLGDYEKVTYSEDGFTDFWASSVDFGFHNQVSERLLLTTDLGYEHFQPKRSSNSRRTDVYRLRAGGEYALSESTSVELVLGGLHYRDGVDRRYAVTTEFNIEHEREYLRTRLSYARSVDPSGDGLLRRADRVQADISYDYSDVLDIRLSSLWRESQQLNSDDKRKIASIEVNPSLSWLLTERLRSVISYRWRYQQETAFLGDWANSNQVHVEFVYSLLQR